MKIRNHDRFFSEFFNTKAMFFISFLEDDFSQVFFGIKYVYVAGKLKILICLMCPSVTAVIR